MTSQHINTHANIIVGMSGGVDSSVSALLLAQQSYVVRGVFMKNWEDDDTDEHCAAADDLKDAQSVCDSIGIPLQGVNFADQYWDRVFSYFLHEYGVGRTPNPDVLCNKEIKFSAFLDYALAQGAEYIATGHYARIAQREGEYFLLRGVDTNKDQSYFLYTLKQAQLARSLFPIGELPKDQVRQIASQHQLITSHKKDSTGICFIGERDFKAFLQRYLPAQPGNICTADGIEVGQHDGLMYYTRGQRQGLHIGGRAGFSEEPWYVADKLLDKNILIAVQGHDHALLYSGWLEVEQLEWVAESSPTLPLHCTAKTRYRQHDEPCVLTPQNNGVMRVTFATPQWAATPGQSIVFYHEDICLGGGIICRAENIHA